MRSLGRLFLVGGVIEALLVFGATAVALTTHSLNWRALAVLVPLGLLAAVGTAAIGRWLLRWSLDPAEGRHASQGAFGFQRPGPALGARAMAIIGLVLLWPFGAVLGPISLWLAMSVLRRQRTQGARWDVRPARQGAVMGALACGAYLFWLFAGVTSFVLFGSPIPAAP